MSAPGAKERAQNGQRGAQTLKDFVDRETHKDVVYKEKTLRRRVYTWVMVPKEELRMMRKSVKVLLVALLAVFTFGSMAEAAQTQKVVRHRARHTSRAASSAGASSASTTKKSTRKSTKKSGAKKRTASAKKATTAKKNPTTKPR